MMRCRACPTGSDLQGGTPRSSRGRAKLEEFVIETLVSRLPDGSEASYYRSSGGAEIDLIVTIPGRRPWAIEVKRSLNPRPRRASTAAATMSARGQIRRLSRSGALQDHTGHRGCPAARPGARGEPTEKALLQDGLDRLLFAIRLMSSDRLDLNR